MKNARGALRIFLQFLKFGCFTFGGGLNIIAQMQRLYVDEEKSISNVELLDLTSVARSLPGLFVGNVAFLYGYRESGYLGAFAALFGMVIPPMIVLSFITYFYTIFHTQTTVMAGMTGVRAAVVPIMASAVLGLLRGAFPMRACYGGSCQHFPFSVLIHETPVSFFIPFSVEQVFDSIPSDMRKIADVDFFPAFRHLLHQNAGMVEQAL